MLTNSGSVLGAMSKSLATIITQPLIVAKVGLQSRPPPTRQGKPFKSFIEVMSYIKEHEGSMALFKGIGPQITKGLLVQGFLMMTKERSTPLPGNSLGPLLMKHYRMEILFVLLFAYLRRLRSAKLQKASDSLVASVAQAKQTIPVLIK